MKNRIDMVNGPLWNKIILFALPLAATSMLQQLFNAADTAVVGRFAGSNALAAVGGNAVTVGLAVSIIAGFSIGPNVVMARLIGEGKTRELPKVIKTTLFLALLIGLSFMAVGLCVAVPFLRAIGTPDSLLNMSLLYFRLYFIGIPFMAIYNFSASIFRSLGDTKRPLTYLSISGTANVLMNVLFVVVFHMGVAGVALATVISNILSSFLITRRLSIDYDIRFGRELLTPDRYYAKQIIREGAPASIQSAVFSISNLFVQSGINSFGQIGIAGSSAALNAEYLAYGLSSSFASAAVTFTGQNVGAGKYDRCKKVFILSEIEGILFTGVLCLGFYIFRYPFVGIFTSDSEVIDFAVRRIAIVGVLDFMTELYEAASGCLRGSGHPMIPSILTLIGTVGFRIIFIYTVFAHYKSFEVLMSVYPLSWTLTTIMMFTALYLCWKKQFKAA